MRGLIDDEARFHLSRVRFYKLSDVRRNLKARHISTIKKEAKQKAKGWDERFAAMTMIRYLPLGIFHTQGTQLRSLTFQLSFTFRLCTTFCHCLFYSRFNLSTLAYLYYKYAPASFRHCKEGLAAFIIDLCFPCALYPFLFNVTVNIFARSAVARGGHLLLSCSTH
jgi:hypothetical protein